MRGVTGTGSNSSRASPEQRHPSRLFTTSKRATRQLLLPRNPTICPGRQSSWGGNFVTRSARLRRPQLSRNKTESPTQRRSSPATPTAANTAPRVSDCLSSRSGPKGLWSNLPVLAERRLAEVWGNLTISKPHQGAVRSGERDSPAAAESIRRAGGRARLSPRPFRRSPK